MRIKTLILFVFSVFLTPTIGRADVDVISFRFNQDGAIMDISTDLTPESRALSAAIVEPDGTLTDPVEEALNEEEIILFNDPDETNERPPVYTRSLAATGEAVDCAGKGGTWFQYGSIKYCCKDGKPLNADQSAFEEYLLFPQCGCVSSTVSYVQSFRETEAHEWVCCSGHKSVKTRLDRTGFDVSQTDDDLCQCPETFTYNNKEYKVRDITGNSSNLVCCAKDRGLQPGGESIYWADCKCPEGESWDEQGNCVEVCSAEKVSNCKTKSACEGASLHWCAPANTTEGEYCKATDCCSGEDGTQFDETTGDCIKCPSDGHIVSGVCCDNSYHEYDPDKENWDEGFSERCGCPNEGELKAGVCCKNNMAWGTDAYDKIDARCGCPEAYEYKKYEDTISGYTDEACCYKDAEHKGQFYGMTDSDADKSKAIRICGCESGEAVQAQKAASNVRAGFVCCAKDPDRITGYTSDVMTISTDDSDIIQKYCHCEESSSDGFCAACWTDAFCARKDASKPYCLVNESDSFKNECVRCTDAVCARENKICNPETGCQACAASTPHYEEGVCYECLKNEDCATHSEDRKICDLSTHTCEKCTATEGCTDSAKPYCVTLSDQRICSECMASSDCKNQDAPLCLVAQGKCAADCGTYGRDEETGDCVCPDNLPVWDIYHQKCVNCYDSVSGAWTDFGCNKPTLKEKEEINAANGFSEMLREYSAFYYSPRQAAKEGNKRVCLVNFTRLPSVSAEGSTDNGTCVECTADGHCPGQKKCQSDHTCACPAATPNYDSNTGKCLECTANNGASSGTKCAAKKPLCKSGTCTCSANYDSSKKNGDGKCPQSLPVCNTTKGECMTCADMDSSKPSYNVSSKKCVACDSNSTYSNGKCVCKDGYGVVGTEKKCTKANTDSIASNVKTNCAKQACQTQTLFTITTVNNMLYELQYSGTTTYGDWAKFQCESAILDKTTSSGTGRTTKQWCSNYSGHRDTNPNDTTYCTTGSSCQESDGGKCGRAVITTSADNVSFLGDGKKCTFSVTNGNGGCTSACNATCESGKSCIKVVPKTTSYDPS